MNENHPDPSTGGVTRRDLLKYSGLSVGALAISAFAAGCSSSKPQAGGATNAASATGSAANVGPSTAPTSAAAADTNFTFTNWQQAQTQSKPAVDQILSKYESLKGIKISSDALPFNKIENQIILELKGGQAKGLGQIELQWLPAIASVGGLYDLSSIASGVDYTDVALKSCQFSGKQLALPWTVGALGMIANTDLLNKAGVKSVPTTVDDFVTALESLKGLGNGIVPYAASTTDPTALGSDILQWIQTFGSPVVDGSTCTLGDADSVAAIQWYKMLYDKHLITANTNRASARVLFAHEKSAFYDDAIVGKSSLPVPKSNTTFFDHVEGILRPTKGNGKPVAQLWGEAVVVFDGDEAASASHFAKYLTSDTDTVVEYFKQLALPPVTTTALAQPDVKSDKWLTSWTPIINGATPNPFTPFAASAQIAVIIANSVEAVLIGKQTPASAMNSAKSQIDPLMKS